MKGILFSDPMSLAVLEDRKDQTRRVIVPQPILHTHGFYTEADWKNELPKYVNSTLNENEFFCKYCGAGIRPDGHSIYKPKYQVKDILYVRETHFVLGKWVKNGRTKIGNQKWTFVALHSEIRYSNNPPEKYKISRDKKNPECPYWYKRLGRFMPQKYARTFIEITEVRMERLQEITEENAMSEGISLPNYAEQAIKDVKYPEPSEIYHELWNLINGDGSWESNPWVFVYKFKKVDKP